MLPANGTRSIPGPRTYRFGACELDEASRSLRANGREIELQPRVFDLLAYLVRNRERVVGKQELLERLWPGTIVVDNALQRVVSLARSALAAGGARDALRTYSRHGYRFCAEVESRDAAVAATSPALERARRAREARDWAGALDAYEAADRERALGADDLEAWGRIAIWAGRGADAIPPLERALALRAAADEPAAAARAAVLLAHIRIDRMEAAVASGLISRAARYLEGEPTSREHGELAWVASLLALMQGELDETLRRAEEAHALGLRLGDRDLECLGLLYRGHALIGLGDVGRGVALHDEAAAAASAGEVSPWVGGLLYCGVIAATRHRCDWQRAGQWTDEFTRWCGASGMAAFPGTCRLYRAEILGVRGELAEAARELEELAGVLSRIAPWAEGDAHRILGEIHLARGELDAAEAAFRRAHALGWYPQPGLARLQLARGRPDAAVRGLEQALADHDWAIRERRGQLLATLALAALAAGAPERAREALGDLDGAAHLWSTPALAAMVATARAELALHERRRGEAVALLRQSLKQWHDIGARLDCAEVRLRLAEVLAADGDRDAAELELAAAEALADRLGAARLRSRGAALRRALQD
ncbi:MAG: winged helix-turn-helix domain-containing protein [Burkholderiales bacterium]|nr:winged helix-turn-helix domain-containing protein [Burkholderiales bacterium]